MPFWFVSRRTESPFQEINSVVESERASIVFNIVLIEKLVELFGMLFVVNIDLTPFESFC